MDTPNSDIIENILPRGEVSILAGSSGCGKSTLLMQALAAFQAGEVSFLGHTLDLDTKWGYMANDHAWKLYLDTAARCRLDMSQIPHISVMDDDSIDLELFRVQPLQLLEQQLLRLKEMGADAIVVDTMVSWFGGDIRSYNTPAYALLRLGRFCRHNQITLLGTHHATKARTDYTFKRPQDRISGSGSLLGFSSTQLCLIPPDENGTAAYQFHIIAHNAAARVLMLTRLAEGDGGVFVPFDGPLTDSAGDLIEIESEVLSVLAEAGEGVSMTRNAIQAGLAGVVSAATLDRHLRHLVKNGLVIRARRGEYRSVGAP